MEGLMTDIMFFATTLLICAAYIYIDRWEQTAKN